MSSENGGYDEFDRSTNTRGETKLQGDDRVIKNVKLPSRSRYNLFVSNAVDELKIGGSTDKALVWALVALAEATFIPAD